MPAARMTTWRGRRAERARPAKDAENAGQADGGQHTVSGPHGHASSVVGAVRRESRTPEEQIEDTRRVAAPSSREQKVVRNACVAIGETCGGGRQISDRFEELRAGANEWPGGDVGEVEVEAAQVVSVVLEVVSVEDQRLAGDGEVEHGRGVVGDQHVGGQVELALLGRRSETSTHRQRRARREPSGDHAVQPERAARGRRRAGRRRRPGRSATRSRDSPGVEDQVVAPGGGVEHRRRPVGDAELGAHPGADLVAVRASSGRRCADSRSRGSGPSNRKAWRSRSVLAGLGESR